jgi:adenylosuccinate synthase
VTGIVIVGANWGDEGKGKITDLYAENADLIVRYAGGPNAGHTVFDERGNKFIFHNMPSGALYPDKKLLIGNGTVIDPETFCEEIDMVLKNGYEIRNLVIDECAHMIMPWHKILDGRGDESKKIGTTKRGIGPAYMSKAERLTAIRFIDFVNEERFSRKLDYVLPIFKKRMEIIGLSTETSIEEWKKQIIEKYNPISKRLAKYIGNVSLELNKALDNGKTVLFEGAQGTLLDIDHGTYPFVTSSNASVGGSITGTGVGPTRINKIIGVAKAYITRVGEGPLPTEMKDEIGERIQRVGKEFGATTGRPRRCGWQDVVLLKYSTRINSITSWIITKLDVLDGINPIKICINYKINDTETGIFPRDAELLEKVIPTYFEIEGWEVQDWTKIKSFKDMPEEAQNYLKIIEMETKTPIELVSVGPNKNQIIKVR